MLGSVRTILDRFRSPSGDGDGEGDASRPERADGGTVGVSMNGRSTAGAPVSSLYECPKCDKVFVAVDKDACGTCDTAVGEVARTN